LILILSIFQIIQGKVNEFEHSYIFPVKYLVKKN
jgi:hypothetical protein